VHLQLQIKLKHSIQRTHTKPLTSHGRYWLATWHHQHRRPSIRVHRTCPTLLAVQIRKTEDGRSSQWCWCRSHWAGARTAPAAMTSCRRGERTLTFVVSMSSGRDQRCLSLLAGCCSLREEKMEGDRGIKQAMVLSETVLRPCVVALPLHAGAGAPTPATESPLQSAECRCHRTASSLSL
jgi:hypothetical protein